MGRGHAAAHFAWLSPDLRSPKIAPHLERAFSGAGLEKQFSDKADAASAYLNGRWKDQCDYFELKAKTNQTKYLRTRQLTLFSSWLTPIAIFGSVLIQTIPNGGLWGHLYDFIPLLLSTVAIGSYQWEELHNYGPQWAKFRLVAERLKNHKQLFELRAGMYRDMDDQEALKRFVEYCEGLIEGTDVNYFILMVDPRRHEAI